MKSSNSRGFTILEIVLTILVVGMLAGSAMFAYKTKYSANKSPAKQSAANNSSSPQNSEGFITIKEWGVRFPTTKSGKFSTALTTYEEGSEPTAAVVGPGDMQFVYIDVKGFGEGETDCEDPNTFGIIYRHKEQNPQINTEEKLDASAQVKIGDFWYSTLGLPDGSNACFQEAAPVSPDYLSLRSKFLEDFKKIGQGN